MTTSRGNGGDGGSVLDAYRSKGLAGRVGFGGHPAVLVIDFIIGFTDPASPLAADLGAELEATLGVLDAARKKAAPVFFTTTSYDEDMSDAGIFPLKVPSLAQLKRGSRWVEIDPRLHRRPSESVIEKKYASAFFGTSLASDLGALGVDTLIITGCTTSGCVRASVVDALQNGFRAIVPRQCVGDRSSQQHAANLIDIDGKYGDVVDLAEVLGHLAESEGAR